MKTLKIRKPDDMHVHLRDGELLKLVAPFTSRHFGRAVIMPNLRAPVVDGKGVSLYRSRVVRASHSGFRPLMTFKILQTTTPEAVRGCREAGAVAGKLYPAGVTTNSDDGVTDVRDLGPVFEKMQELGIVLCVHGEAPESFVLDRERDYLPTMDWLASSFPRLRIVLEHVTTAGAVDWVMSARPLVAATVTVHHLMTTLDHVMGGLLNHDLFCKPVPKRPEDMAALREAVGASDRFFFGSDSAPHCPADKFSGCAGVFSAPVAVSALFQLFEELGYLDAFEAFTSERGARFYGLSPNLESVEMVENPWDVPAAFTLREILDVDADVYLHRSVVPFLAKKTLRWRCVISP